MPSSPNITLTATLDSILGGAGLQGYLEITLCGFGIIPPRVAGTAMLSDASIPQVEGPASSFSIQLFGNDQITPGNTFYSIAVLDEFKNVIQAGIYQLTGSGTFDLSALSPIVPASASNAGILSAIFQANPTIQNAAGTIDGVNQNFTFTAPPGATPTILVFAAGIFQTVTTDYSLSYLGSNTWQIHFVTAPTNGPITVLLFQLNGSNTSTITAPRAIVVSGAMPDNTILCNFSVAGAITLPAAGTAGSSYQLTFKDISGAAATNNITLNGTIDGGSSYVINANYGAVTLRSDGTQWWVISKV